MTYDNGSAALLGWHGGSRMRQQKIWLTQCTPAAGPRPRQGRRQGRSQGRSQGQLGTGLETGHGTETESVRWAKDIALG